MTRGTAASRTARNELTFPSSYKLTQFEAIDLATGSEYLPMRSLTDPGVRNTYNNEQLYGIF